MKKYPNYFLTLIFALGCFSSISAISLKGFFVAVIVGSCTFCQASPTARVKIKPYAYFGTNSGLVVQDLYRVPASFAAVCCKKGALQKNPDCGKEAIKIADALDSKLVSACCAKETLQERSNCFEFKKS